MSNAKGFRSLILLDESQDKRVDIWMHTGTLEETEANANLIAEAFNVANECGLTPAQLLEQRNELLEALDKLTEGANFFLAANGKEVYEKYGHLIEKAITAINKATNNK